MRCPVFAINSPAEPEYNIFCSQFSLNWSRKTDTAVVIEDEITASDSKGNVWYCNKSCYYAGKIFRL